MKIRGLTWDMETILPEYSSTINSLFDVETIFLGWIEKNY